MADGLPARSLKPMAPAVMERASDLREFVDSVAGLRDAVGVLSITIGIDPGAMTGGTSAWEIAVDNDLARLRRDRAVGQVLVRRSKETSTRLTELLDATSAGRGRALYVALETGESSEVTLQGALPTGARVGSVAHVLPLLAVLDEAEPAGLISASRDAISVLESELGMVRDVDHIELEPSVGDWWPEMKGPARANPLRGQHTVSHKDRYARRLAAAYRHTLDDASGALVALARERTWKRAVLAGDPRTIDVLDERLRAERVATTTIDANLEGLRREDAVGRLENARETLVARQQARLAEDVVSAANGVCGLVPVLAVLAEARVDRLLIDASRTFPGVVGTAESLSAAGRGEDVADLTDLIVARALATDAAVTPLRADAAAVLAVCDGLAALLRW
jgi:hypothetical protein